MARIRGGITGRPSGTVANIVFGAARTREGKVVTARERVTPSNPRTTEQTEQRNAFSASLARVKRWGPSFYQEDWNRAIGQLPGFQSLMSLLLSNVDKAAGLFTQPAVVPLGDIPLPTGITIEKGLGDTIQVSWSDTPPPGGLVANEVVYFAYPRLLEAVDSYIPTPERIPYDGIPGTLGGLEPDGEYIVGLYVVGKAAQEGKLSQVYFTTVDLA
jgi:hypothetical protein